MLPPGTTTAHRRRRWIDVVTPGTKLTSVQRALALRDVRDDGTGSTLQAL
jgi:hypothetical protein